MLLSSFITAGEVRVSSDSSEGKLSLLHVSMIRASVPNHTWSLLSEFIFAVEFPACKSHFVSVPHRRLFLNLSHTVWSAGCGMSINSMKSKLIVCVPPCMRQHRLSAVCCSRTRLGSNGKYSDIIHISAQSSLCRLFHYTGNEEWERSGQSNKQF